MLRVPYEDAVGEALYFGWMDIIVKRLNDKRFAQKFAHRRHRSKWSKINKEMAKEDGARGKDDQCRADTRSGI